MALVDTLKYIQLDELSRDQKKELKKVLVGHKKALEARIKGIDKELAALEGKRSATKKAKE